MNVINAEFLMGASGTLKFLLNDTAIMFFPATQQHREVKAHGLSYEDDYRGNAVAGMVIESRVEIRFHTAYSDDRMRGIWKRLLQDTVIAQAGLGRLLYQGREIV